MKTNHLSVEQLLATLQPAFRGLGDRRANHVISEHRGDTAATPQYKVVSETVQHIPRAFAEGYSVDLLTALDDSFAESEN